MNKIIECPRCHLPVESDSKTCKFCGENLESVKEDLIEDINLEDIQTQGVEKVEAESSDTKNAGHGATEITPTVIDTELEEDAPKTERKKLKLQKYQLFYLIAAGIALLMFVFMLLPGASNADGSIYTFIFDKPTIDSSSAVIGTNAATITFLFAIIGALNILAILISVFRKTTEVTLFSYFSIFYYLITTLVSFLSSVLLSTGLNASAFDLGIGFIATGIISIAAIVILVFAVIEYKKFLKNNPLESFKA